MKINWNQLKSVAKRTLKFAYSPYSKKKVSCAILSHRGATFSGCNVENASFGATICAERTAIVKMVSEGHQKIQALVVMVEGRKPWAPCGLCRQMILEFASPETPILMTTDSGHSLTTTVGALCPMSFSPQDMRK